MTDQLTLIRTIPTGLQAASPTSHGGPTPAAVQATVPSVSTPEPPPHGAPVHPHPTEARMPGPQEPSSGPERPRPDHDAGMSTVEYAVGTVVAAAFAAVLYRIVTGDSIVAGLTNLVQSALNTGF